MTGGLVQITDLQPSSVPFTPALFECFSVFWKKLATRKTFKPLRGLSHLEAPCLNVTLNALNNCLF